MCLLVIIKELTDACAVALLKLRTQYQKLLTNALSHERITPINSIISVAELLMKQN